MATVELQGEGMFCERDASLLLVSLQGGLEKHTKPSGSRGVTHITSKEEMCRLEGEFVRCEGMIASQWVIVRRELGLSWGEG